MRCTRLRCQSSKCLNNLNPSTSEYQFTQWFILPNSTLPTKWSTNSRPQGFGGCTHSAGSGDLCIRAQTGPRPNGVQSIIALPRDKCVQHTSMIGWPPDVPCSSVSSMGSYPDSAHSGWPVRKRLRRRLRSMKRLSPRPRGGHFYASWSGQTGPQISRMLPGEAEKQCHGCRWSDLGTARLESQSSRRRNTWPVWRCRNKSERGPHRADAMDRWHRFQPDQSWDVFDHNGALHEAIHIVRQGRIHAIRPRIRHGRRTKDIQAGNRRTNRFAGADSQRRRPQANQEWDTPSR